ncbi:MAG: hypothetical protein QXW35_04385 [Candidatus Aenigmatarchaeota archaeon]
METKIVVFNSFILIGLYDKESELLRNTFQVMVINDKVMLVPFLFGACDGTVELKGSYLLTNPSLELIKSYNDASTVTAGTNKLIYS